MHEEVLSSAQDKVLGTLGPLVAERNFYMGGGTAVAIQLGHRRSVDLDWFTPDAMGDPLILAGDLRKRFSSLAVGSSGPGTLHATIKDVLVSFLEYKYPLLRPPVDWADYGCVLASAEDLACMKLSAVASRGAKKDFLDIYALGRNGFTLDRMLSLYQTKYQTSDFGHVLYSLAYFDDADADEMPEMLWEVNWAEAKRGIEHWIKTYERRHNSRGQY